MKSGRAVSACVSVAVACAVAAACGSDKKSTTAACTQGTVACQCYPNDTCNDELTCVSGVCVDLSSTEAGVRGGSGGTAGGRMLWT